MYLPSVNLCFDCDVTEKLAREVAQTNAQSIACDNEEYILPLFYLFSSIYSTTNMYMYIYSTLLCENSI